MKGTRRFLPKKNTKNLILQVPKTIKSKIQSHMRKKLTRHYNAKN